MGQTKFYNKGLTNFEKATYTRVCRNLPKANLSSPIVEMKKKTNYRKDSQYFVNLCKPIHALDIKAAIQRWNKGYKNLALLENKKKCDKRVTFPANSPVTHIYYLVCYETARRLLRRDQNWISRENISIEDEGEAKVEDETRKTYPLHIISEEQ